MSEADKYFMDNEEQIEAELQLFSKPSDDPLCVFRIEFRDDGVNVDALISSEVTRQMLFAVLGAVKATCDEYAKDKGEKSERET